MKSERAKSRTDGPRRHRESPMRKDKPEQRETEARTADPDQPLPGQPEEREPLPRRPGPVERHPDTPRERSDEDAIGRPVQLDEDDLDDVEKLDAPTRGEPPRERQGRR